MQEAGHTRKVSRSRQPCLAGSELVHLAVILPELYPEVMKRAAEIASCFLQSLCYVDL